MVLLGVLGKILLGLLGIILLGLLWEILLGLLGCMILHVWVTHLSKSPGNCKGYNRLTMISVIILFWVLMLMIEELGFHGILRMALR